MIILEQNYLVYLSIIFVIASVVFYAIDKWSIIYKSALILSFLLIFFSIFPFLDSDNNNLLGPKAILSGFSNLTLITVCSLLILGQGIVNTKALDPFINKIINIFEGKPQIIFIISLFLIVFLSAFMNNTPVVIIFIPVMQVIAQKLNHSVSRYLMPLSYAAILGGSTTLIGSSTNLLVANSLNSIENINIGFFDFIIPGSVMAFVGIIYILIFSKFLLKPRSPIAKELIGDEKKEFIAQLKIHRESSLVGQKSEGGKFSGLENVKVLIIQRKEHAEHGPLFNDFELKSGDILVIATSQEALAEIISKKIGICGSEVSKIRNKNTIDETDTQILTEAVISPSSSLVGQTIENSSFRYKFNCVVIGLQRKDRLIKNSMTEIPLETGDVLLIQGTKESIKNLRTKSDIIPLEWSTTNIIDKALPNKSIFIFFMVIILGIFEIFPLVVSALLGVICMIATNVLTTRQAMRAIDSNLLLLIVTSLALGKVILETGTANYLAINLANVLQNSEPIVILSCFFILVSIITNFISNNACAVLFTPIAIDFAQTVDMDPKILAISVIFAVNTSFLTPMAYQTNLLVMSPGHYKFIDYLKFGIPLTIVCWVTFTIFFSWYYNLI
ncbi:MAG: SLC13 family permease [Rickettsiales bacterium]|nr:SLC13 family permease [Rickettsiales bacterium]